jgi:hypothetical protein
MKSARGEDSIFDHVAAMPVQQYPGRTGVGRVTVAGACFLGLFSIAVSGPTTPAQAQQFAYCKADIKRLCRGVRPGGGRMMQCLKAHENDLTVGCAKELQSLKGRMGR